MITASRTCFAAPISLSPKFYNRGMLRNLTSINSLRWGALMNPLRPTVRQMPQRIFSTIPQAAHSATSEADQRNSDRNSVAVIVGASRGIGLAVVQALVGRWKGHIVATCRNVQDAGALGALWQFMPDRFSILPMDVCDENSVCSCCKKKQKTTVSFDCTNKTLICLLYMVFNR